MARYVCRMIHDINFVFKFNPVPENLINSTLLVHSVQGNHFCSSANSCTVEHLVFIFTRRPFSLDSPQLQDLRANLTPQIVEAVLKSLGNWRLAQTFFNWASKQQGFSHSCYTYNAMASLLADARQNASLRELAVNLSKSSGFWTPGALGYFLRCLGSLGMVTEANYLFDQMKNTGLCIPNSYSYSCLLEAISKTGVVDLMECRLNEMRNLGWPIDKHALTPALQCYCNARHFEKALMVFKEMVEKGWADQHVSTILVLSYSKSGNVESVFELIEWMETNIKISLNEKTFCVLIHGFMKNFRLDGALKLYDKMKTTGHMADISIYDVLIDGLCQNQEIEKALVLYTEMEKVNLQPDVRIISKLLSSIPDEREMIELFQKKWEALDGKKGAQLYFSLLTGFVKEGLVDKAYHLLKLSTRPGTDGDVQSDRILLVKKKLDTGCFQTVIDGLCKADKLDMALDLFHDMDESNCARNVLLFNNLINDLSNADRLDECIDLLNMMKLEFQPTHFTFNCILGCLCRREDVAGALDILKEMRVRGHEPWIKYYTLLVKKLCEHGRAIEAHNFLTDMTKMGFFPDMIAYSAAIAGFINMNDLNHSLELFKEMCERGYYPDVVSYNIIIKGLCKVNRLTEAEENLSEMLGKGLIPSVVTYNLLIDAWCKDGNIDQAMLFFSRMKEETEPNVITYTTLVNGLLNVGKVEDALNLWIEMERNGCSPNKIAYMALIHGLCKCEKPDVALIYLQKMEQMDIRPDTYIYQDLIIAFESTSNLTMAVMISEKMVKHGIIL